MDAKNARDYFLQKWKDPEGRKQIYKQILAHGYSEIFSNGFALETLNENFKDLPKAEKAMVLQGVLESLNLNLKQYSSKDKKIKFMQMKEREESVMRKLNPKPVKEVNRASYQSAAKKESVDSDEEVGIGKKKVFDISLRLEREQKLLENDLNRVTLYNPYMSRVKPKDIQKKYNVLQSSSID